MLPAMLKAWLGEGESRSTSARVISTHNHLRQVGRFRGGRVPYGYKAIDNPDGAGRVLALDEGGTAEIARELAQRVIAGHTVNSVIRLFNDRGVPAPQKDRWQAQSARGILRSTALMGPVTPTGERIAPGIVTADEYDLIQKALASASVSRTRSRSASPLLGLVFCGECGGKLYRDRPHKNYKCLGSISRYEVAEPCTARGVPEAFAETIVQRTLLGTYGQYRVERRVAVSGSSERKRKLDDNGQALVNLAQDLARGPIAPCATCRAATESTGGAGQVRLSFAGLSIRGPLGTRLYFRTCQPCKTPPTPASTDPDRRSPDAAEQDPR